MKALIEKYRIKKLIGSIDLNNKTINQFKDKDNNNLLHLAILSNDYKIIKKLSLYTHLLHEENKLGYTPIHLARYLKNNHLIERLNEEDKPYIKVEKGSKKYLFTKEEFSNYMEVEYISNLEFENPKIFNWLINKCIWANRNGYISYKQKWLGAYFEKEIFSGHTADVSIKWINSTKEFGLVTNVDLPEKKYVGEYVGLVHPFHKRIDNRNSYCFEYLIGYEYKTKHTIDARDKGNIIRFINHSFLPNLTPVSVLCGGIMHIIFRTNKFIKKGSELTYDYGPNYWQKRENPIE